MEQEIDQPDSTRLIDLCMTSFIGLSKKAVRAIINPLMIEYNCYLHEDVFLNVGAPTTGRGFMALKSLENDEDLIRVSFKNGVAIDQTFSILSDDYDHCKASLRAQGFVYNSGQQRWNKAGISYTWRVEIVDEKIMLVLCRRLLKKKLAKVETLINPDLTDNLFILSALRAA